MKDFDQRRAASPRRIALRRALAATVFGAGLAARAQFVGPAPESTAAPVSAAGAPAPAPKMTLLPGDLLEVRIFGIPQYDYRGRIDEDGNVALPLAGTLRLGNLSVVEAQGAIAGRLAGAELVKNPQVNLHVLDSPNRIVTVSGEVKTPGPVPVYGEKRLLDAIAAAGGFTPLSSPAIAIFRRGIAEPLRVVLPPSAEASARENIVVLPGDNVVVSRVGVVYVLGAVRTQGAIPLKTASPLTLIEALALAGGVNYEAALNQAYILRVSGAGRTEIPFNVAKVVHRRAPDESLRSDDIVLIPPNGMKAALKGGAASVAATLLAGVGYIAVR